MTRQESLFSSCKFTENKHQSYVRPDTKSGSKNNLCLQIFVLVHIIIIMSYRPSLKCWTVKYYQDLWELNYNVVYNSCDWKLENEAKTWEAEHFSFIHSFILTDKTNVSRSEEKTENMTTRGDDLYFRTLEKFWFVQTDRLSGLC